MNWLARLLIIIALIAGAAAVLSLQQGGLVFILNGTEMRASASAAIALLILYTLAVIVLTRLLVFLFVRRPHAPKALPSAPPPKQVKPPTEPQFVEQPLPLDAAPSDERK